MQYSKAVSSRSLCGVTLRSAGSSVRLEGILLCMGRDAGCQGLGYNRSTAQTWEPDVAAACMTGQSQLGAELFLPWAAWMCVWTAAMIFILSACNICSYVSR